MLLGSDEALDRQVPLAVLVATRGRTRDPSATSTIGPDNVGRNTMEHQQECRVEHHEHHEARVQAGSS